MKFFMENNNQRVLTIVMVATVLILVIIFSGVTYAFFTANNPEGSTAQITSKSGRMLITYNDGTDNIVPVTNIQPSNKILVNKTFTLTGTNTTSGLTMPYKVGIKYINGFSNGQLHYYIKRTNQNANITSNLIGTANQTIPGNTTETGYTTGTLKKGNRYLELATGEFKANTTNQTITFNLILQFPDTGENQDSEKGKTFNGKVVVNYELETIAKTLSKLDKASNGLEADDTPDKNLRYIGASPKNYINFNNETWRIIGVFNNITTTDELGKEKNESLVKIVRNDSLGDYSWDSSVSNKNSGWGINEWSQADLMTELNNDYINSSPTSETTLWYNGTNNAKNGTYDYNKNIKSNFIDKIATVRWNLGGYSTAQVSASNMYTYERGTTHVSYPTDGITRTDYWDGKVALIYPSDYGYASTDTTCRSGLSSPNCKNKNWLFNSAYQWTLLPISGYPHGVFYVLSDGNVGDRGAYRSLGVFPAVFLKSDVVIVGGTGTESNPFILE